MRRIAFIGDSIAASYDYLLPKLVAQGLAREEIDLFAVASQGDDPFKLTGHKPLRGVQRDRFSQILRRGCDEIILEQGVNSIADGRTSEDLRLLLETLCEQAMDAGVVRIVLVEIAPWAGTSTWTPAKQEETLAYNSMIADLAAELSLNFFLRGCDTEVDVAPVYQALEDPYRPGFLRYPREQRRRLDPLHPSMEGLKIMAREIAQHAE